VVPIDFILFALTLVGVAVFHHHTLAVALTGLAVIIAYQLLFSAFPAGPGGLRQYPADETRVRARRLRLGHARVCGGLWRLDDLVRIVRVAITNLYPDARSVGAWIKSGWHVASLTSWDSLRCSRC